MKRQPILFIGHGSPMNAVECNPFTRCMSELGESLYQNKPDVILIISAHWLTRGSFVATTAKPETIYDFTGFPAELYQIKYPADGSPETSKEVMKLTNAKADSKMGLDHGAWTILKYLFPKADIPCLQLSIDYYAPMQKHYELGKKLLPLRDKNILIIGSGNIVHNIRLFFTASPSSKFDWAYEFDDYISKNIMSRNTDNLINYQNAGESYRMAVPTPDHYIPLLYTMGLLLPDENISFPYEEIITSLSMRCVIAK